MANRSIDRELGETRFRYGNHIIAVAVQLKQMKSAAMNSRSRERGLHRLVKVKAQKGGKTEVKSSTIVSLEHEHSPRLRDKLSALVSDHSADELCRRREGPEVPSLEAQLETTVRDVFEELDEIYEFTSVECSLSIEASIERVKHDVSWVEIDDELDRLSAEIDGIGGGN